MLFIIWYYLTMSLAILGGICGFVLSAAYINTKVVNKKMSSTMAIMYLISGPVVGLIGLPILTHVIPPVTIVFYVESFFRQKKVVTTR